MQIALQFVDPFLNLLFRFAGMLLKPAIQLIFLSFFIQQIIIRQIGVLLFDLTFCFIPVAFQLQARTTGIRFVLHNYCFSVNNGYRNAKAGPPAVNCNLATFQQEHADQDGQPDSFYHFFG